MINVARRGPPARYILVEGERVADSLLIDQSMRPTPAQYAAEKWAKRLAMGGRLFVEVKLPRRVRDERAV